MVREGGIEALKDLLDHLDDRVLINVVQTMANCAEDYRARFMLQVSLPKVWPYHLCCLGYHQGLYGLIICAIFYLISDSP